ncbi:MAG TPA: hypothetical protein DIS66_06015 [Candidatus Omnitrophica bacterium]|nr:hypothetical protein [Candidatus Omnitrophota bacterium]
MKKQASFLVFILVAFTSISLPARAEGIKQGVSSFVLPTTGQAMNGEFNEGKTKLMATMEVAAITTTVILASVVGGPVVWAGIGPLIANHTWSGYDAYKTAKEKNDPYANYDNYNNYQGQQVYDARRDLDLARQQRYDYANNQNLSLRERMRLAAEQANG